MNITRDTDDLMAVNTNVNTSIAPRAYTGAIIDKRWLIHPPYGDCNAFAVTKRHDLLARGWSANALLLAEVVTAFGEHHLVLVVRMPQGDVVLDNLTSSIRPWNKTGYRFVRMQNPSNPQLFVEVPAP